MNLNPLLTKGLFIGCVATFMTCSLFTSDGLASIRTTSISHQSEDYFYADFGVDYAITNYEKENINAEHNYHPPNFTWSNVSNGDGGVAYSGDVGYQFSEHFAVEFGGGELPTASYTQGGGQLKMHSWYMFSALNVNSYLGYNFSGFGEAGLMYRHLTYHDVSTSRTVDLPDHYFAPMIGCGLYYHLLKNARVSAEYDYLAETFETDQKKPAPSANLFMAKLGYQFQS